MTTIFWILIAVPAVVLLVLVIREVFLLAVLPAGHPDRGLYIFNSLILFFMLGSIPLFAQWVISRAILFEQTVPVFPESRNAPERELFDSGAARIYETTRAAPEIFAWYDRTAREKNWKTHSVLGDESVFLIESGIPGGPLYITVKNEGGKQLIFYSREGTVVREGVASPER